MRLIHGDCLEVLRGMADASVDSIVTDPPYGLSFMGKKWDYDVPAVEVWAECLRVLKPGGYLLAFAGTRTQHRMAVRIEDAGFEIRDMVAWVYGSGFPKSLDVSKAIDKAAGVERETRINERWAERYPNGPGGNLSGDGRSEHYGQAKRIIGNPLMTSDPATDFARQWSGWGTALKPALEPITVARKPLIGTVAENVLTHGTGALNIDGCRVGTTVETWPASRSYAPGQIQPGGKGETQSTGTAPSGRWPANFIFDGSDEVVGMFPNTVGQIGGNNDPNGSLGYHGGGSGVSRPGIPDSGSASRFFYCAKASRAERDAGLEDMPLVREADRDLADGVGGDNPRNRSNRSNRNHHPTVKPIALMRYLCRLVTPPGVWCCPTCYPSTHDSTTPLGTASPVSAVRRNVQAEGQRHGRSILLEALRGSSASEADTDAALRTVQGTVHPGQARPDGPFLFPIVREQGEGSEVGEGLRDQQGGLSDALPSGTPDGGAFGLCDGTSAGGGGNARPDAAGGRSGPPHQREQVGQPAGEPAGDAEAGTRPHPQAAAEANRVPPLRGQDGGVRACAACGAALVERPGVVLDPFTGSGTTGIGAALEGFDFIGIEREADYAAIAERRIECWQQHGEDAADIKPQAANDSQADLFGEATGT